MKVRVGRAVAGTMAVAAATLMAAAGTASADIPPGIDWDHTFSDTGVRVYVEEHGDIISVCDTKANGHAGAVIVEDVSGEWYELRANQGSGTCRTRDAGDGARYNLTENSYVVLEIRGEGGPSYLYRSYLNDH